MSPTSCHRSTRRALALPAVLVALGGALLLAPAVHAQTMPRPAPAPRQSRPAPPPRPDTVQPGEQEDAMGNMAESADMTLSMLPMMQRVSAGMMQGMLTELSKPETARQMATFTKNYFDALVAKGFTRDEALRIVMAQGFPAMPGMR